MACALVAELSMRLHLKIEAGRADEFTQLTCKSQAAVNAALKHNETINQKMSLSICLVTTLYLFKSDTQYILHVNFDSGCIHAGCARRRHTFADPQRTMVRPLVAHSQNLAIYR